MRALELAMGLGLLLGPLVYALTLDPAPAPECAAVITESAPIVAPNCEQPEPITVEIAPEPVEVVVAREPMAARAPFLFVTDAGLLLSTEAEHAWGEGRLFVPPGEASFRAAKRANPSTIPAELWSMRGRTFNLYGRDGQVCSARLGELRVVAQYGGWSLGGVLGEEWREQDPEGASKREILDGLWRRDDLWLVAEIESPDSCEGALWARDAELPPPMILRSSSAPNRASEARLAAFARSEEFAETARTFQDYYATLPEDDRAWAPTWESTLAEHGAEVQSWLDAQGQPQVIRLDFGRESEGCGDPFESKITALEYVRGDEFVAVPFSTSPHAVFDADFDGQLEFLHSSPSYYGLASATLKASTSIEEDWYCPC
jgi:hypothetical protein